MTIDITKVGEIIQDFHNRHIEIKTKEGYSMWQKKYISETAFNKAFREINKKFYEELKRREKPVEKKFSDACRSN